MRDDGGTFSVLLVSVSFYGMGCGERVKAMTNNTTVYAACCCGQLGADLAGVPDGRSQDQKSPSTANLGLII
jgi:hypothetical protein